MANIINGTDSADSLVGTDAQDIIYGNGGDDVIYNHSTVANGDAYYGGSGNDTFYLNDSSALNYTIDGGDGTDTLYAEYLQNLTISNVENLVAYNTVYALGTQIAQFSSITDSYASDHYLYFFLSGVGTTLNFGAQMTQGLPLYVVTNGMTSSSTVTLTAYDDSYTSSYSGDTVHGGDGNDYIAFDNADSANPNAVNSFYGDGGDDRIFVSDGTNTVDGGSGNDEIVTWGGSGTLSGGTGDDLFILNEVGAGGYTIDGGDGTDTIEAAGLLGVTVQNVEDLIIENGIGPFATTIATLTAFQSIQNQSGDLSHLIALSLSGSGGTLDISQKIGTDTLSIDASGLTSAANVTLSAGADEYQASHYGDTVHAGDGNDEIFDNYNGNNTIYGEGGNDYIVVGSGHNYIDGGDGNDNIGINDGSSGSSGTLIGGAGDDTFDFTGSGPAAYVIDGGAGNDLLEGGNFIGATITNIETLKIGVNYWGSIANLAGITTIESTLSNTTISFAFSGAGGTLDLSQQLSGDNLSVDASGLTSAANVTLGAGNDTYQASQYGDTIHAGDGNDYIYAIGSNNVDIDGGNGNDTITVGNGSGALIGGAGDDTFNLSGSGSENYVIDGGTGNDTVTGSNFLNTTISNVETLKIGGQYQGTIATLEEFTTIVSTASNVIQTFTLSGAGGTLDMHSQLGPTYSTHIDGGALTSSLNFIGSAASDTIIGTAFNDTINGGAGADTMEGGAGDDTYYIDNAGDFIVEQIGQGHDTAISTVSHTLESNVEDLILQGSAAINGTGNGLDNSISGNDLANTLLGLDGNDTLYGYGGNDILDGGTGVDKMYGGTGDDTYYVDDVRDQVIENANEGTDTVIASINYVLPDNVENLTLSPTTDLNGTATGNALDNIITGNSGNNVLAGKGGNDILIGGAGADTLDGTGSTTAIASYSTATSGVVANLANATQNTGDAAGDTYIAITGLTGSNYADHLTGNSGNNVLKGGLGSDILDGGAGTDTAVYDFAYNPENVFSDNGTIYVYDPTNKDLDQLTNIELLQFANTIVSATSIGVFDVMEYIASNPDLIKAFGTNITEAEQHFLQNGAAEGRSINSFDALEYIASNPDLIQAFGTNTSEAEQHYIQFGFNEHRSTNGFDALEYIASNPDLIQAFGTNTSEAEQHYIQFGFNEHRSTNGFDALEYIASNPDLIQAFGTNTSEAEQHYIQFGFNEHRSTNGFDAAEYLASNPDLIALYGGNLAAVEKEYIDTGFNQHRSTDTFNAAQYLANYPDLQAAFGNDYHAAEMHYILYGYAEHRTDQPLH